MAMPAELRAQVLVVDPGRGQLGRQGRAVELRVAGVGVTADVGDQPDVRAAEQLDELALIVVGVADGEDLAHSVSTVSSWE